MSVTRSITFGAPMIRALRRAIDPKTQTRRISKPQPIFVGAGGDEKNPRYWGRDDCNGDFESIDQWRCPYGVPGDRLRVREAFRFLKRFDGRSPIQVRKGARVWYEADGPAPKEFGRYRHARFMPRWASRSTVEVVSTRLERLFEISERDARAEGMEYHDGGSSGHSGWRHDRGYGFVAKSAKEAFGVLWVLINGAESLHANPWVWVVEFKRIEVSA